MSERWILENSVDNAGTVWNNSQLVITKQTATAAGFNLEGYFDWISNTGHFGREIVTGSYTSTTRRLLLFGQVIDPTLPSSGIVTADYGATLSFNGLRLQNGSWSASGVIPGVWGARRGGPPPPTTTPDAYPTAGITPLVVPAPGVLSNDSGATSATLVAGPSMGTLSLSSTGGFTFVPPSGFSGTTSFTYRAVNAAGPGNIATVTIAFAPAPTTVQPPTNFRARSIVGNAITLAWTPPAAGPTPTGYLLEGGVTPGQVLAAIPTGSATPTFTLAAPNGAFYLRLKSLDGGPTSAAPNEIRVFVNQPVAPSAPSHLTGLTNGSQVGLSWRNTFAGGTPSGITLDVSGTLSGSLPLGPIDTFTFPAMPAGTYTFSVRATNAFGASSASNAVTLSFPNGCTGAPQVPENFLAYAAGNVLNVTWDPAGTGAATTSYVLNVSGAVNVSVPWATRGLTVPVPPGSYTFSVAAANACGASAATATQTAVVP